MIVFDQLRRNDPHLRAVTLGTLTGMAILITGLWWVQIVSHRHYSESQKNQSYRTVRIPAVRGKILDRDGVALIRLNRPEKLNACSGDLLRRLSELHRQCDDDDSVRAVVLTGSGRAFCAGADMSDAANTFSMAGMKFFGMRPPTTLSTNSNSPSASAASSSVIGLIWPTMCAYWPEPPVCFLCLPWTSARCVIVSLYGTFGG